MDFRVAGFDPDINTKYARFEIDNDAYTDFDFNGEANGTLKGYLGPGGSTHSQFLKILNSAKRLYADISTGFKDVKTAQENFKDMEEFAHNAKNKNKWWSSILSSIASVGATSWIPALGPLVGVVNFIMGGGSHLNRQPRPISLTGRYKLKGTLSQQSDINAFEFIVPGAKIDNPQQAASYNELPLYNKKEGVFNLV
jgi:hypothetical protein